MNIKLVAASLAMVLVAACGKEAVEEGQPQAPAAPAEDPQVTLRNELVGSWGSNCIEGQSFAITSIANLGITQRSKLSVNGDAFTETATISSSACDGSDIEITTKGTREAKDLQKPDVRGLNVKIDSYQVKPLTEFGVRVLNISKWCGVSDWTLDRERDVTSDLGKEKCFSLKSVSTVYAVEGNNLYFGGTNTLSSSANPSSLDLKRIFFFTRL